MFVVILISLLFSNLALAVEFEKQDIVFESHDTKLSGSIILPKGKIHAAVVFVHGSGKQTRSIKIAELFAKEGIATLVYDKRGVGKSEGEYESKRSVSGDNLALLADDAANAFLALNSIQELVNIPKGLTGISQAGWIVPISARKLLAIDGNNNQANPRFIVLWSGPVNKVSEEDIYSKYTADTDAKRVPSYQEALDARTRPYIWPSFLGRDVDPTEDLSGLNIKGLWIFGKQDGSIPVDLSIQNLEKLVESGHQYEYVLFSALGHNNIPPTIVLVSDWIKRNTQTK